MNNMDYVTEASELPDESYHTIEIEALETGDFRVTAENNDTIIVTFVGSIAMEDAKAGFRDGQATFDTGSPTIDLEYVDYSDEYGYEEIEVHF